MLAQLPPLGWNSWNTFGNDISEDLLKGIADKMVETGLKDAGYEYIVIDDCWSLRERDPKTHEIVTDPEKFPHGMKALADYIHSKGLKFGMYSCAGTKTCAGYPSSFEYEFLDAMTFAKIGIDFLKYDFCYKPHLANGPILYNRMSMALKTAVEQLGTNRPILFSACNWGSDNVGKWIRSTGAHMYRSTGDINDSFGSFKSIAMSQIDLLGYSAPGCYNDIDMLICGMRGKGNVAAGGCSDVEYRTHFALWCLFASPLMIGCDIRNISDENLALLKNKELLSINQDEEARPPFIIGTDNTGRREGVDMGDYMIVPKNKGRHVPGRPVMFKHLANNEYILAFFNLEDNDGWVYTEFYDLGLSVASGFGFDMYDIFTGEEKKGVYENMGVSVPAHDCKIYRCKMVPVK